jgi:hypothetical protein
MKLREKIARAIWEKRPDEDKARRAYFTASLDTGRVAACDLCFDYADAAIKIIEREPTK